MPTTSRWWSKPVVETKMEFEYTMCMCGSIVLMVAQNKEFSTSKIGTLMVAQNMFFAVV